jgi:uncharacterized protein (TIGR02270 family)
MIRPLLEHPSATEFLREFQEEHLSELTFLIAQRQRYLHDPELEWPDVESLEIRILRHTEALQAGGELALECVRQALTSEEPDELAAGAYTRVLLASGGDGIEEVLARMTQAAALLMPCFIEALTLARHPQLSGRLGTLLASPRPELRAAGARILGHRHDGGAEQLLPLLDDVVLEVRTAAALALGELGHRPALPVFERKLSQAPPNELGVWVLAALRLGSTRALHACRQACQSPNPLSSRLPWLLGLAGDTQDFAQLRTLCGRPDLLEEAIEALGLLGVPAAVPLLMEQLDHKKPEVQQAAARALNLMTGAGLTEKLKVRDEDAADDDEEAWHEVIQPNTNTAVWRAWWAEHRSELEGTPRLRMGRPYSPGVCIEELAHPKSPFDTRARAALELGIRTRQTIGFQPDWPTHRQSQALEQWRHWLAASVPSR